MNLTDLTHTRDVADKLAVAHRGEDAVANEDDTLTASAIVQAGLTLVHSAEPDCDLEPRPAPVDVVAFKTGWGALGHSNRDLDTLLDLDVEDGVTDRAVSS